MDTVEGPVMVVAGPGTGKTQILTLRIANILRVTDTNPSNVLALTFTEAAASSIRRRLVEIVGSDGYSVTITTFHGFCNEVIRERTEAFPHMAGADPIAQVDQIALVESAVRETPLEFLRPLGEPLHYVKAIIAAVNELKREGLSPEEFLALVVEEEKKFRARGDLVHEKGAHAGKMKSQYQDLERQIAKNKELALVYRAYQEKLQARKSYDYNDMIMEVLDALRQGGALLQGLQERYQYILVDEHQDTNSAQNKILEILCGYHKNPNIFIVGDEKQAIFRFQGASLENFLRFKKLYPEAELVTLRLNYRSAQHILDSAHSLIPSGQEPLRSVKKAGETNPRKIIVREFMHGHDEMVFLAKAIREKIDAGTPAEEITVLYRDNNDIFPIASAFEKIGVPFRVESDQNILGDRDVRKLITLLRATHDFGDDEKLIRALHVDCLGLAPLEVYKLVQPDRRSMKSVYERLAENEKFGAVFRKFSRWKASSENEDIPTFFEQVVRESGFLKYLLALPDSAERLEKVNRLFDEAKSLAARRRDLRLKDFLVYLDTLEAHNVLVRKGGLSHVGGRVRCMTAHRAKGLEFDYVYIAGCFDKHWGNRRGRNILPLLPAVLIGEDSMASSMSDDGDERRLFYVALTRAREGVAISYAKEGLDGQEQVPAQFIAEIRPELVALERTREGADEFPKNVESLFGEKKYRGVSTYDKEFVRATFLRQGLSVTALNNYLACPWRYFYLNLLRVPRARVLHQMYGIAVHAALRDLFTSPKLAILNVANFLDRFERYLANQPIEAGGFEPALKRGREALRGWYSAYASTWRADVLTELRIRGVMLGETRLTGVIDKLEFLDDRGQVNVVDYKTGRPKSRNEIEGGTKNSTGDFKRQLVFYNLLLNRFQGVRYKMASGEIDFVEPDARGRYHKERFEISPDEVRALEKLIARTAEEILNLKFWDARCDDEVCEHCELRAMTG